MEAFYWTAIGLLSFFLLYILIRNKLIRLMDQKLKSLYKEKISADIQNIYRELENYSAIIDSRIGRLKTLTERQEASLKSWENIQKEIKKSKAGKEFLNYMDEQNQFMQDIQKHVTGIKKEITDDLKLYLAKKLNLTAGSSVSAASTEIVRTDNLIKGDSLKKPEPKGASKSLNDLPLNWPASNPKDEDFNPAELLIDEIDEEISPRKPQSRPRTAAPNVFTGQNAPGRKELPSKNTLEDNSPAKKSETSGFFGILGSIGRSLGPLFFSQSKETEDKTGGRAETPTALTDAVARRNFNDLMQKEISGLRPVASPGTPAVQEAKPAPQKETQENLAVKSIRPDELMKLMEALKNSKSRPDALKRLLSEGFGMEQIAELSNVPYSDLELTQNLYNIRVNS